jgi:hypothetical protein
LQKLAVPVKGRNEKTMKKKIISRVIFSLTIAVAVTAFAALLLFDNIKLTGFLSPEAKVSAQQDRGWKVWVKTSPCAGGRTDWISVAKVNPTEGGGGGFWETADLIQTPTPCTRVSDNSCTFAAANAAANAIRASNKFADYCCKDYSVWQNTQTREMSVVKGSGSAGFGWQFEDGPMCCEEAEAITGKSGLCGGTKSGGGGGKGGKTGYIGCYKDTSAFDLDGFLERSRSNTPQRCVETCRAKGFAYAAVQYGESCLCGNSYGKYGTADNCNYKCTGDGGQNCGGYNANSVYGTGLNIAGGGKITKKPGGNVTEDDGGIIDDGDDEIVTPKRTPSRDGGGQWTLISVTAIPETPNQTGGNKWSYNAQSSSANLFVYNGDKHNFQWTKPPQQIDGNGFTVSLNVQCQSQPNNRCASLIGVAGVGLESDTSGGERKAEAYGENGALGRGQKSVTFKPIPNSNELEVRVEMMWGAVKFIYKYRRT